MAIDNGTYWANIEQNQSNWPMIFFVGIFSKWFHSKMSVSLLKKMCRSFIIFNGKKICFQCW